MSPCRDVDSSSLPLSPETKLKFWSTWKKDSHVHDTVHQYHNIEDANTTVKNFLDKVGRDDSESDSDKSASPEKDPGDGKKTDAQEPAGKV
jgi:hypothetical protein